MKQIPEIATGYIDQYFPDADEGIKNDYLEAAVLLSEQLTVTVQAETRLPLLACTDDVYSRLRKIATASCSFVISSELKSRFDSEGGGGGEAGLYGIQCCTSRKLCRHVS